jgi:hypothetical protein
MVPDQRPQDSARDTRRSSREVLAAQRPGRVAASRLKYAGSNLIKHDAPVLATLQRGVERTPLDLRCPGSLYIVFGCPQTRQQFGGEDSALIRLKLERLSQDTVCRVGHVVILLRVVSLSSLMARN